MKSKSTRLLAEASVKEYIRSEKSYKRKGLQEKKIWFHISSLKKQFRISIRKKTSHLKELLPWLDEWRPATGFWNFRIKSIPRCSKLEFKQPQNLNLKATTSEPIHKCKKIETSKTRPLPPLLFLWGGGGGWYGGNRCWPKLGDLVEEIKI